MQSLSPDLHLLIATAWVDGHLDPEEKEFLLRILAGAGLTPEQAEAALGEPRDLEAVLAGLVAGTGAETLMRQVLRLCFADGVLELEEFDLIERVAERLQIDGDRLEQLRQEVSS